VTGAPPDDLAALEGVEAAGWVSMFRAAPPTLARDHGIEALARGRVAACAVRSLPGMRLLNHALGLGLEPDPAGALEAVEGFYGGLDHVVSVPPGPFAAELGRELTARGFAPDYAWVKFRHDLGRLPDARTDLRVVAAEDRHAAAMGAIVATAFGLPPPLGGWLAALVGREGWSCYVALAGDEPVAGGGLYVEGATAWLAFGATRPEHRGLGAQGAMLAARLRRAAELGCALAVSETGAPVDGRPGASYRNLRRSGFEEAYARPNWRPAGPAPAVS
jgi:GNAT superfamily N-acetyltransferase